ncbi:hypothetical protein M430DRAFT_15002 [Amorphotheca resinae ATCC 22711]|uniref:Uncharacterized protein n=1 Tax=Amorphotheca resinae ATCC 22711 TaxID=857342 RepID=A0A2T3BEA9_AMORE|nr:hypothetical protein M430DRAFT_15002 [Amorphotheca resinae ATCC 22711]PSS27741.1 hypothetical protein M430DRAFT_15002 [Amorphotheca resinae ATCC 22711]
MSSSDSLQLAQVLADLNTLQNTDPEAAHALLLANKTLSQSRFLNRKARASIPRDPPEFDFLGRRITSPKSPPSFSRAASSTSVRSRGSQSGVVSPPTPVLPSSGRDDEDIKKAEELVRLYDMRWKFKQMGDTGLTRAKERVDLVVEKYAQRELEERRRA